MIWVLSIEEKIHLIQAIFQKAKATSSLQKFQDSSTELIINTPNEYVSVIFEGASMGIASESFKSTNSISSWLPFFEAYRNEHSSQILVGLGWALFENSQDLNTTVNQLDPQQAWRVLDAYGFCHGFFKRNESIRKQRIPEELETSWVGGFNQGLGRCLWHISRGNVEHLVRMINLFPAINFPDLWRGIGIAITYVGGVNEMILSNLKHEAGPNLSSLKCGISFALHSRKKAQSFSEDAVFIGNFFLNSIESATKKIELVENQKYDSINEYRSALIVTEPLI